MLLHFGDNCIGFPQHRNRGTLYFSGMRGSEVAGGKAFGECVGCRSTPEGSRPDAFMNRIAIGGHCTFWDIGGIDVAGGQDFGESSGGGRHRTACAVPLL